MLFDPGTSLILFAVYVSKLVLIHGHATLMVVTVIHVPIDQVQQEFVVLGDRWIGLNHVDDRAISRHILSAIARHYVVL